MVISDKYRPLYLFGLALLAMSIPLSNFMMSVSQFILAGYWLLSRNYKIKLQRFWKNKEAVVFSSILLISIIGLLYSQNTGEGLADLRIKLPILILPFIIASTKPLSKQEFTTIMWAFVVSVFAGSVISYAKANGYFGFEVTDPRKAAFISHIRFGLMTCMAVFFLFSRIIKKKRLLYLLIEASLILWLVNFLFALKLMTGVVVLFICTAASLWFLLIRSKSKRVKIALVIMTLAVPATLFGFSYRGVQQFYDIPKEETGQLEKYTKNGEAYEHRIDNQQLENGHYTWRYIAWDELQAGWKTRSDLDFWGEDKKGQPLHATLIRFLTSKGLRKDMEGVNSLSEDEVKAIENGIANVRYMDGESFQDRVYKIIWQVHNYSHGGNPQGSSVTQRLEFWKTGWAIFKKNPVIGVGTGDVKSEYNRQYERMNSPLSEDYRLGSHNQYISYLAASGILGLLWFLFALLYPLFFRVNWKNYYFVIFILIALLSMIDEDTLGTQAGVTFVAFFYSFFLFGREAVSNPNSLP